MCVCACTLAECGSLGSVWETVVMITFLFCSLIDPVLQKNNHLTGLLLLSFSLPSSSIISALSFKFDFFPPSLPQCPNVPRLFVTLLLLQDSVSFMCRCDVGVCRSDWCLDKISCRCGWIRESSFYSWTFWRCSDIFWLMELRAIWVHSAVAFDVFLLLDNLKNEVLTVLLHCLKTKILPEFAAIPAFISVEWS